MKLQSVDRSITVQSSNVDLGTALPAQARQAILRVAGKYFGRLSTAAVHFAREGKTYRCTVNMQVGGLKMMSGEGQSADICGVQGRAGEGRHPASPDQACGSR
jgi:hypothetical protein